MIEPRHLRPLRLGVFGGSFDPVHAGHVSVAERAQAAFELERIFWIPARRPPHKPDHELADDALRMAMAMIATVHEPSWEVLDVELEREGPSYTYDTLLALEDVAKRYTLPRKEGGLARRRRDLEMFLIIGSDNLPGLPGWRNAEDVLAIAQPIVVWRGDGDPEAMLEGLEGRLSEEALARVRRGFLEVPPNPHSATEIRAALARGEVPEGALEHEVLEFIAANGLYGWPADAELPPDPRPPRTPNIEFGPPTTFRERPDIKRRER